MNGRLVDLTGLQLVNRLFAIALAIGFLALTLWRFSMTERAPSKRKLRKLAKREARDARVAALAPTLGGDAIVARDASPSRWVLFFTRLWV
jgi:hypothetical protein